MGTRGRPAKKVWDDGISKKHGFEMDATSELKRRVTIGDRLEEEAVVVATYRCGCEKDKRHEFCKRHGKY